MRHEDSGKMYECSECGFMKSTQHLTPRNKAIAGSQRKPSSILQKRIAFRSLCLNTSSYHAETKSISANRTNLEQEEINDEKRNCSNELLPLDNKILLPVKVKEKLQSEEKDCAKEEDLYEELLDGTYACNICQTTFEQKSRILRHIFSKHSSHRPFKCSNCDKTFKFKSEVKIHKLLHQDVDSSLLHCCSKCDYRARTKYNLKSHYIRKHTDDYKFGCEHCGKRFKMEWDLKFHTGIHGNSQHMCDICGKFYTSDYSLYKHRKVSHLNEYKFQCSVCNRKLLTQENLDNHMRQHSKTYECKECGKVFTSKRYLATHLTVHTTAKPYTCHICKKNFRTSHIRKAHLTTHSAEKPHMCDLCGQSFKRRYYMIEHRKKHPDAHLSSPPIPLGKKKNHR
ncbi:unnamed protein product [Xylocopa violacea]|uniref:C2H2-type domain-containing protein n=1 Tax=Xylocopa violacea TaxID=135666 RepID=A0ABP1N0R3_XYLVO